ncbi:MAG: glycosyltransferase [Mitsuaria chitosanitabida]|uniref:glycosyltransferase n=1 Tax=Roseateles chitosanitabidus TaxID=65048 RepID=UPI001B165504|nr:glycosyltransferase [Roseateles chitosanitabidus]MBO9689960.1 glycosyltransferase [Roseateles chitosanitabidus]
MSAPEISVVMPTYRRPDLLERCLRALMAQTLAPTRYEVLVVDDGHEDRARTLVERLAAEPGAPAIRYLRPASGRGPAVARNTGWRAAVAPLVAFTDDDTRPDVDWLRQGLSAMLAHPAWIAAAGRVRVPPMRETLGPSPRSDSARAATTSSILNPTVSETLNPTAPDPLNAVPGPDLPRIGQPQAPTDHELMTRGLETAEFVTANAFVRREALVRIDGFDERFQRAWREDSDLQFRLQAMGELGRADAALVWHPVRPERWGVSLRQQRNIFFDALLYRKHPRLYRERVRPVPPWDYYAVVLLTAGAATLALTGNAPGAVLMLAAAIALVLRIAVRRLRRTSHAPSHVAEMLCTSAAIPFLSVYWRLRGAWHFRTPFL